MTQVRSSNRKWVSGSLTSVHWSLCSVLYFILNPTGRVESLHNNKRVGFFLEKKIWRGIFKILITRHVGRIVKNFLEYFDFFFFNFIFSARFPPNSSNLNFWEFLGSHYFGWLGENFSWKFKTIFLFFFYFIKLNVNNYVCTSVWSWIVFIMEKTRTTLVCLSIRPSVHLSVLRQLHSLF